MMVHCKSKEDDLGIHYIGDGSEYTWRFKPRLVFGRTQFWCYVAPVSVALHIQFDAYIFNDPSIIEYKYNVYWLVKPDGVYIRDPYDGKEEFRYRWAPGRIVV
ncbi:S-protein homolog 1 [Linum grandiflorum]